MLDVRTCLMDARDLSLEAGVGGRAHRHERSAGCVLFSDTHADVAKRAAHASGFAFEVFFKGRKQGTLPRFHPIKQLVEARQRRFRIGLASHQPSENCRQAARFEARAAIGISGAIGVARFGPAAWIGQGAERIGSPLEDRLTAHQLLEFLRQLFLIKHLPAGRTVDAGPHLSDLIFVRKSHFGLMLNEPLQDIVVKCKIGRRHRGPAGEDGQRANDDPERYAPDTHRPAAVEQRAAALWHIAPGARTRRGGAAARVVHRIGLGPGVMVSIMLGMTVLSIAVGHTNGVRVCNVVGLRPVGHQRLHGGRVPPPMPKPLIGPNRR